MGINVLGFAIASTSVVINNLYVVGVTVLPREAYSPLSIDPDAVASLATALEML